MRVISTFLPPAPEESLGDRPTIVMAFDTLVNDKSLVVGITVGLVQGPDLSSVRMSAVGHLVLDRAAAHHRLNHPDAPVVLAGVASVAGAKERVRQVLAKAPEHALLLLLCANDKVYDAAFPALNVDFQSANQRPQ